jgi:photosystem II stability/assembly factor-like uncharacterized protein
MPKRVFLGTRKGFFEVVRDPAGRWKIGRTAFLGDHVVMLLPDTGDGRLYAALHHGHFGPKLHRSDDDGTSWQECAVPAYPERPPEIPPTINPMSQQEIPWKLDMIWALESAGNDRPGAIWCGTVPGGLFRSTDRGQSWELIRSLWDRPERSQWIGGGIDKPGIHSVCVHPRDSRRVAIGISSGGVWMTGDDAKSWACRASGMRAEYMPPDRQGDPNIQDAHRLVQSPSSPEVFWVQHHNGIFRTVDGGVSWREISAPPATPSAFGFAVAVHPKNADIAWFVPAIKDERRIPEAGKVVVSRTTDGGKTFQVLRKGLPQEHAYDLVFRHGLDVDETGNLLAMGSTTGTLWITENGGERWTTVSEHLPPIYCVRIEQSA